MTSKTSLPNSQCTPHGVDFEKHRSLASTGMFFRAAGAEGSGAYRSSGGRSGAQGCTAHTVAQRTRLCRNNSRRSRSLPAASRLSCSHTLQHTETTRPELRAWGTARGKTSLSWASQIGIRCCSKRSNHQSAHGTNSPKHPKNHCPALQPPARALWLCVPTQAREGQILTLAQRVVEVAWSTLVTRVPFKSCPAQTLPCLAVTGAIVLTRARALAGCKATRALLNKQVFVFGLPRKGTRVLAPLG